MESYSQCYPQYKKWFTLQLKFVKGESDNVRFYMDIDLLTLSNVLVVMLRKINQVYESENKG